MSKKKSPFFHGARGVDDAPRRACAFIVIPNFAHLAEAYGPSFASGVSREIKRRLCAGFVTDEETDLVCLRDDCFLLRANDAFSSGDLDQRAHASEQIELLLAALSGEPVRLQGIAALVHVHADWIPLSNPAPLSSAEIELLSWAWAAQPLPGAQEREDWRQRYRADMDVAVRVSEALAAGSVELRWQPIVDAHRGAATFYREARTRLEPGPDPQAFLAPGLFMPSLERLGLARMFDRSMVCRVVEVLRLQPDARLAINISAQSATLDHWWASLLNRMRGDPALAQRLVVEINGRVPLADLNLAREFCAQLQQHGCRIAIDDFGGSGIDLGELQACRPDIVKLDTAFIRGARESESGRSSLRDMLGLCRRLAPHVIVDGIDQENDLRLALQAGARWLQGYYLGGGDVPARVTQERQEVAHSPLGAGARTTSGFRVSDRIAPVLRVVVGPALGVLADIRSVGVLHGRRIRAESAGTDLIGDLR